MITGGLETAVRDQHVYVIGKSGWIVNLTINLYIMWRQRAGLYF